MLICSDAYCKNCQAYSDNYCFKITGNENYYVKGFEVEGIVKMQAFSDEKCAQNITGEAFGLKSDHFCYGQNVGLSSYSFSSSSGKISVDIFLSIFISALVMIFIIRKN